MNPDQKNGAAPLFSVITVSFNAMPGLLESVQSLKAQTAHSSAEWVVVDGASTDGSAAWLAAQQPDVFVSEPDRGIYDAMNKAISRASGQWLFFLNAGDTFADAHVLRDVQAAIAANLAPTSCMATWCISASRVIAATASTGSPGAACCLATCATRRPFHAGRCSPRTGSSTPACAGMRISTGSSAPSGAVPGCNTCSATSPASTTPARMCRRLNAAPPSARPCVPATPRCGAGNSATGRCGLN